MKHVWQIDVRVSQAPIVNLYSLGRSLPVDDRLSLSHSMKGSLFSYTMPLQKG